jgi:hypothetical protein
MNTLYLVAVSLYNTQYMLTIMYKNILNGIFGAISLILLMTTTMMVTAPIPSVDAATGNATQAANQTGEKMQAGIANVTQESKSAANQTGEKGQSMLNKTGEAAQSLMNKTGETLQQINPFK